MTTYERVRIDAVESACYAIPRLVGSVSQSYVGDSLEINSEKRASGAFGEIYSVKTPPTAVPRVLKIFTSTHRTVDRQIDVLRELHRGLERTADWEDHDVVSGLIGVPFLVGRGLFRSKPVVFAVSL